MYDADLAAALTRIATLEVQLADSRRLLVAAMEQARVAEKKASRLGHELEKAQATLAELGA